MLKAVLKTAKAAALATIALKAAEKTREVWEWGEKKLRERGHA